MLGCWSTDQYFRYPLRLISLGAIVIIQSLCVLIPYPGDQRSQASALHILERLLSEADVSGKGLRLDA